MEVKLYEVLEYRDKLIREASESSRAKVLRIIRNWLKDIPNNINIKIKINGKEDTSFR